MIMYGWKLFWDIVVGFALGHLAADMLIAVLS